MCASRLASLHKIKVRPIPEQDEAHGAWYHTVCPPIAVSRAFGDRLLKKYVVAEPDILDTALTGGDTLLIMATDGLWDVVSNQDAISMVRVCACPAAANNLTYCGFRHAVHSPVRLISKLLQIC